MGFAYEHLYPTRWGQSVQFKIPFAARVAWTRNRNAKSDASKSGRVSSRATGGSTCQDHTARSFWKRRKQYDDPQYRRRARHGARECLRRRGVDFLLHRYGHRAPGLGKFWAMARLVGLWGTQDNS